MKISEMLNSSDDSIVFLGLYYLGQTNFLEYLLDTFQSTYIQYVCARILSNLDIIYFSHTDLDSLKLLEKPVFIVIQESMQQWDKMPFWFVNLLNFVKDMKISELLASDDIETVRLGLSLADPEFKTECQKNYFESPKIFNETVGMASRYGIRFCLNHPEKVDFDNYLKEYFEDITIKGSFSSLLVSVQNLFDYMNNTKILELLSSTDIETFSLGLRLISPTKFREWVRTQLDYHLLSQTLNIINHPEKVIIQRPLVGDPILCLPGFGFPGTIKQKFFLEDIKRFLNEVS